MLYHTIPYNIPYYAIPYQMIVHHPMHHTTLSSKTSPNSKPAVEPWRWNIRNRISSSWGDRVDRPNFQMFATPSVLVTWAKGRVKLKVRVRVL